MDMGCIVQEVAQSPFALYLVRAAGTYTYIGLCKERIASLVGKLQDIVQSFGSLYLSCRTDTSGSIILLHLRFLLDGVYLVRLDAGVHVEVGSQSGILLQPVFVVALYPVNTSVLCRKMRHGTIHLVVVLHIVDAVILGKRVFQPLVKIVVRRIADTKNSYAILLQCCTEVPVVLRKIG